MQGGGKHECMSDETCCHNSAPAVHVYHIGTSSRWTELAGVQVVALDLTGIGLVGNVSEGRWGFMEDLPYLTYLSIMDNPGVIGTFPSNMRNSIRQIAASGTGASAATKDCLQLHRFRAHCIVMPCIIFQVCGDQIAHLPSPNNPVHPCIMYSSSMQACSCSAAQTTFHWTHMCASAPPSTLQSLRALALRWWPPVVLTLSGLSGAGLSSWYTMCRARISIIRPLTYHTF